MLTEQVELWTTAPSVRKLGEGQVELHYDGLPRLIFGQSCLFPATLPAVWSLRPLPGQAPGPLLTSWEEIEAIRERLKEAEREAEEEERDQAERLSTENRIAAEIDERREEEHET